jgi:polyphosphate glucokinase
MEVLGLDIGGTGIKGALVDTEGGEMLTERYRLLTPQPATPKAMIVTIGKIVSHFDWQGPVGCGFPSAIKNGVVLTAANVSKKWIGFNLEEALREITGCEAVVLNDADAAGLAEMRFGAGRSQDGVVLIITLGTGIGVALFVRGQLVPNLELGHIEVGGKDADDWASAIVREQENLSWQKWAKRVDKYLTTMEYLLWPDLIIIGGGVSKKHEKFFPYLTTQTPVLPAEMRNQAGIVGAALAGEMLTS